MDLQKPKPTLTQSQPQSQPQPSKTGADLNEIMRRLRILEERYSNLRKKNQLSDQNMLEDSKRIFDQIAAIQSIISELKKDVNEVNSKMRILDEEVNSSVQKRELSVLNKYLEFWEPLNFVKRDEAKRIIEDTMNEIKNKPKAD